LKELYEGQVKEIKNEKNKIHNDELQKLKEYTQSETLKYKNQYD
jgi:hypothetical protein